MNILHAVNLLKEAENRDPISAERTRVLRGDYVQRIQKIRGQQEAGGSENHSPLDSGSQNPPSPVFTAHDDPNSLVGYLRGGEFYCPSCNGMYDTEPDARVYLVNITPYKQYCCDCGQLIVVGRTPAWCELFTPRGIKK